MLLHLFRAFFKIFGLMLERMSRKATNRPTNFSVSVLSRTDKQEIDYFIVKPRNIGR